MPNGLQGFRDVRYWWNMGCGSVALTDVDGGLLLVSCQDPDLDIGLYQSLDGLGDLVLESVLNGGGP